MAARERKADVAHRSRPGTRPAPERASFSVDLTVARSRLRTVVQPFVAGAGYDLEGLTVKRIGRRHVVQIIVDRDGGVSLDAVADLARDLSTAIDDAEAASGEVIAGEYQLEVSSPGTDRPLRLPRHWRRNMGRLVRVTAGGHGVLGRVVAATDEGVRLDCAGDVREYAYADLGPGRVEIEFNRLDEVDDEDLEAFGGELSGGELSGGELSDGEMSDAEWPGEADEAGISDDAEEEDER